MSTRRTVLLDDITQVARTRVRINDEPLVGTSDPQGKLDLDVGDHFVFDKAVAAAEQRVNGAAALQAAHADPVNLTLHAEAFIGYTPWNVTSSPPCTGYWDDNRKGGIVRVWYDAERKITRKARNGAVCQSIYAWRGLKAPWPEGYTYKVPGKRVKLAE